MARIIRKQTILGGKPIIAGTRIGVDDIARYLAHDYQIDDIQNAYPHLTKDQLAAALDYLNETTTRQLKQLQASAL